jgi:hypothetical protein
VGGGWPSRPLGLAGRVPVEQVVVEARQVAAPLQLRPLRRRQLGVAERVVGVGSGVGAVAHLGLGAQGGRQALLLPALPALVEGPAEPRLRELLEEARRQHRRARGHQLAELGPPRRAVLPRLDGQRVREVAAPGLECQHQGARAAPARRATSSEMLGWCAAPRPGARSPMPRVVAVRAIVDATGETRRRGGGRRAARASPRCRRKRTSPPASPSPASSSTAPASVSPVDVDDGARNWRAAAVGIGRLRAGKGRSTAAPVTHCRAPGPRAAAALYAGRWSSRARRLLLRL